MGYGDEMERRTLAQLKEMLDREALLGRASPEEVSGQRYELAVRSNDVNGNECRFPSCSCPYPDCSESPLRSGGLAWFRSRKSGSA